MGFQDVNDHADSIKSEWFAFKEIGDKISWKLVNMEVRDQHTPTGVVVLGSKTGKPRKEWVVTGADQDGTIRKCALKEGAQRAVTDARDKAGAKQFEAGGLLELECTGKSSDDIYAYKEYTATYTPPQKAFNLDTNDDAESLRQSMIGGS
jgi:hypothetical protein